MTDYDYLFFDGDDTLFDFQSNERDALCKTLKAWKLPLSPQVLDKFNLINGQLWLAFERREIAREELIVRRFAELLMYYKRQINWDNDIKLKDKELDALDPAMLNLSYMDELSRQVSLLPDAEPIIRELKEHYQLVLTTNGNAQIQKSRLERSVLADCFQAIFVSERMGLHKPNREFFDFICDQLEIKDRSRILIIGDSLTADIQGGKNAGIATCWFNPGGRELPLDLLPDYSIRALRDLRALLL